jgi:hypothetical protein
MLVTRTTKKVKKFKNGQNGQLWYKNNPGGGGIFRTRTDLPWGSLSLLYNGSFLGVKRPGRGADHPPPPSAEVANEEIYTATPLLGLLWPVIG